MDSALKHLLKLGLKPEYRKQYTTLNKLEAFPRYQCCYTDLLGHPLELVDAPSFVPMYKEIFCDHIYRFRSAVAAPLFIDGGANIGLGILYVKKMYPESRCIAFEPDRNVFQTLQRNMKNFGFSDVTLVNKALWSSDTELEFSAEGSNAGSILSTDASQAKYCVQAVELRDFLQERVDFLKLDIEGAETEVVNNCRDLLGNVDNLFVEYHSFAGQPQNLLSLLEPLYASGFRLHIQAPAVISSSPLFERHSHNGMDLLLNIFGYRDQ